MIRFIDKPDRMSLMEFLYCAGDDRFGALGVSTSATEYTPKGRGPLPRLEDAQTLSEAVAKVQEGESLTDIESQVIAGGGTPLGGAKPKALILIDNTDDHEKNHSLLVVNPGGFAQFRLAPAYDVLPSNSGQGFQELICGDDLNSPPWPTP